jgi:hypothetical protein
VSSAIMATIGGVGESWWRSIWMASPLVAEPSSSRATARVEYVRPSATQD